VHYKDGTPAKLGDVIKRVEGDVITIGQLKSASASSETCNGLMIPAIRVTERVGIGRSVEHVPPGHTDYVTLKECEKLA
jgi:hypothetical protein